MFALAFSKGVKGIVVLIGAIGLFMSGSAALYTMCEGDPVPAGYANDPAHNQLDIVMKDTGDIDARCAYLHGLREDQLIQVSPDEQTLVRWCKDAGKH